MRLTFGRMLQAPRHLASIARWAATRRSQERDARDAIAELRWSNSDGGFRLPPGLGLRWLGVAGFELSFEGTTILVDPYLTRLGLADLVRRRRVPPEAGLIAEEIPTADAVLVGHTHFDHVLDVPEVVRRHGCPAYGSGSVRTLLGLYGLADRAVVVEPYRVYEVGPFEITFVPSAHSKLALGLGVPQSGPLTCDHLEGLCAQAYRCDQVWGIHIAVGGISLYHQGSAELVDDAVVHNDVDVFLCGIAGRGFSTDFTARALGLLDPKVVVPHHYDDFLRPFDASMGFTVDVDVAGFVEEVARVSRDIEVRTLDLGERLTSDSAR